MSSGTSSKWGYPSHLQLRVDKYNNSYLIYPNSAKELTKNSLQRLIVVYSASSLIFQTLKHVLSKSLCVLIQFYKIQISSMNTSIQIVPLQNPSILAEETILTIHQTKDEAIMIANNQLSLYLNQKCFKNTKKNTYNWNRTESAKYVKFLKKHGSIFTLSLQERKSLKINLMMSQMIKTRSASQCRSHHQKMMFKFASIVNIIDAYDHLSPKKQQKRKIGRVSQRVLKENQSLGQSVLKDDHSCTIHVEKAPPFWLRYANLYESSKASFCAFDISQS